MNTWSEYKLGDICINITDGKHGDCQNERSSGYFFISSKDVHDGKINYGDAREITEVDFEQTNKRTKLEAGDTVITNSGTIGRMAFVKNNKLTQRTTFQKSVAIIKPNTKVVSSEFLYYLLLSNKKKFETLAGGSAQHNLLLGDLRNFRVKIPHLSTQHHLASVLFSYDQLIENNEKRIKNLEEMAQRLYTEWFVKFRFPGYEKVKMVDSGKEYGMIPEGWGFKKLDDLANFVNGYAFKPSDHEKTGFPIVKIPELRDGILEKTPRNKGNNLQSKYFIKNGDILFSWSATLLIRIWNSGDALLNQHLFRVTPKKDIYYSFLYLTLNKIISSLADKTVGATMKHLRREAVTEELVLFPDEKTLIDFQDICSKFLNLSGNLETQNQTLKKTRDLLIPQLVTGRRTLK